MRNVAPWPVDWIDTAEAIARRGLALLDTKPIADRGADLAGFSSGKPNPAMHRFLGGLGLRSDG